MGGGAGNDVFGFFRTLHSTLTPTTTTERNEIRGFDTRYDQIDPRAIDANTKVAGDRVFLFTGKTAFTGKTGELIVTGVKATGTWDGPHRPLDSVPGLPRRDRRGGR